MAAGHLHHFLKMPIAAHLEGEQMPGHGNYANTARKAMPGRPASTITGSATARAQTARHPFGAIVAFAAAVRLVLNGRIRFSRVRFASIRPVVIGPASSQSPAAPSNEVPGQLPHPLHPLARLAVTILARRVEALFK